MGQGSAITNSYATGTVTGGVTTGGLAGRAQGTITNSYATGSVEGRSSVGGLAGYADGTITNSYATGSVTGQGYNTGGLAGWANGTIANSYATGDVHGNDWTGGLVGQLDIHLGTVTLLNTLLAQGNVSSSGGNKVGGLIGGIANTSNGTRFATINITNASASSQGLDMIGFEGKSDGTAYESGQMEDWLANITETKKERDMQVGIHGDSSSQISFDSTINLNLGTVDIKSVSTYDKITSFLNSLSTKSTELGAVTNRLESALDSIGVSIENLTSSRSTIKDADIAKVSSEYIRQQILQQASATLLATANQSPSIALQLI